MPAATIRPERPDDAQPIHDLTRDAFAGMRHASGTEAAIPGTLRSAGALTLSLVAVEGTDLIGHAAFSPVTITPDGAGSTCTGWYGLGPVAVRPDRQRSGTGSRLIDDGLRRLRTLGARGCVVLGSRAFYGRFGFVNDAGLIFGGAPAEHFQRLTFIGPTPSGKVTFHPAFAAAAPR